MKYTFEIITSFMFSNLQIIIYYILPFYNFKILYVENTDENWVHNPNRTSNIVLIKLILGLYFIMNIDKSFEN